MTPLHINASFLKKELANNNELALLDVREQGQYGEGHPFHAAPLAYSSLELEAGRLIPNLAVSVVLFDDGNGDTLGLRAASRLIAMGYQNVRVLEDGISGWREAGYTLFKGVHVPSKTFGELVEENHHTPRITPGALKLMMERGDDFVVLDGRSRIEFTKMNIPGAVSCPNAELAYRLHRLAPDNATTIVVNCAGRTRSIIGAQTLINLGIDRKIFALENGTQGWFLNDYPLEHNSCRFYPEVSSTDEQLHGVRKAASLQAQALGVQITTADQLLYWRFDESRTTYFFDVRTREEFEAKSVHGAIHAEGGQLLQGTDLYMAVRHARVVLLDTDGIRAPLIGSWLHKMGFEVYLLEVPKLETLLDFKLPSHREFELPTPPAELLPDQLRTLNTEPLIIDLRFSQLYRSMHLKGAIWSTRSRIRALIDGHEAMREHESLIVLVATKAHIAALATSELSDLQRQRTRLLTDKTEVWIQTRLDVESTPDMPADDDCLDYLFFVHDRHDGNKNAAKQYLEWEKNLVSQLDEQERLSFKI